MNSPAIATPRLFPAADNLWSVTAPQSFFGLQLGTRMTVVRLANGGVLIHSPVALQPALRAEVDAIGPVRHIMAPNLGHHLYAGEWADAYPDALVHAAKGLEKRRKDLRIDHALRGSLHEEWRDDLEAVYLAGTMLGETVFLHRPSRSLIVADAIENIDTSPHWPTRAYLKLGGIHGRPGVSRGLRPMYRDRPASRRAVDEILTLDFDRIVLAHHEIIETDGVDIFRDAYKWLKG